MDNWFHQDHHGRRDRNQLYSDQTICTFLMLKGNFSLTLCDAVNTQGRAGALEEDVRVPSSFVGRDGDISVQAVDDGQNQSANIQRSGRGSDGVC